MRFSDFLRRQQPLLIGHANALTDADIIALAVHELRQLLSISSMDIRLIDGYWHISADEDWISNLVGHDIQHYFNGLVTHPFYSNATFVLGGMLNLHVDEVATFKDEACDWYKGEQVFLSSDFKNNTGHKSRVLLFKEG